MSSVTAEECSDFLQPMSPTILTLVDSEHEIQNGDIW